MTDGPGRSLGRVLVVALVLSALTGTATAGNAVADATPAFVVDVQADGDATVTLRLTFDRTTAAERRAFDRLRADRANVTRRFEARLAAVAATAADRTGREMAVDGASVRFETLEGSDVGVVELSAEWTNLARVDGDRVVLAEPFASGFEADRAVVVRAPAGYALVDGTPAPTATEGRTSRWAAGTSLEGFRASYAPSDDADGTAVTTPTPLPTALLAATLLVAVLALRRRAD